MQKLSLIIITLFAGFWGQAQPVSNKEDLLQMLKTAKEDTAKVLLYLDIGNRYESVDAQIAGKYYLLAGGLSKRLHYKRGIIKFISNYTAILNGRGDFDSALLLNRQSIEIAKELNDNLIIGKTAANTGNSFSYLSEYDSAIYYYETAGKYFEDMNDGYLLARMYEMEQLVYEKMGQYKKALQHGVKAVTELRTSGDSMDLSRSLLNLGNSYQSSDFPDSALSCYKEALFISKKISYQQGQIANLLGIGNIFFHRYNADMMKPYFEEALTLAKQSGDQQAASIALRGMAFYYLLKKELDKAKKFCVASLQMADSAGTKYDKYESMHALSSILYAQGNIIDAERVKDQMNELENEIRGDELQQKTILIEKKFETGKKEAQIKLQQAQLQQKNTLNYLLGGTAFSAILIGFFGYRNYQHRQKLQQAKIDELETEKQLTVTEAVLKGEEQERTRLAKDLHDGLGGMLSGIKHSLSNIKENLIVTPDNMQAFERSIDMLDGSIREMRRVAHNMMPEILLKYGLDTALKEFCAEVDLSGALHVQYQSIGLANSTIDQTISVTIYRVVQELVNNVIKHAAAKNVLVQVHLSEQLMALTVEDDGKGFDVNALQQSPGIGWSNIKNRIEFLKGRLDVQSDKDSGTSVWIEVKV